MNFQELYAEVVTLTKRPDLSAKTEQAIRAATLRAHQSGFYPQDVVETGIEWNEARNLQNFTPRETFTRYRRIKYLRYWTPPTGPNDLGAAGPFFTCVEVNQILDGYGYEKNFIYYLAGDIIQIRSFPAVQYMLSGYYADPNVTAANYSSWIARDLPYVIVYDAARRIQMDIGNREAASDMTTLVGEQYNSLLLLSDDMPGS